MTDPLLRVAELRTHFHTDEGVVRAVDGVGFAVGRGAGKLLALSSDGSRQRHQLGPALWA